MMTPPAHSDRRRHSAARTFCLCIALIATLCVSHSARAQDARDGESISSMQIRFIFPGMYMQGTPYARYETPPGGKRLELRAATGERVEALFCPAFVDQDADAAHRPTVLYFYGNAQCIATALSQIETLRRCGANVLVADYLGYGLSEGKPSEAGCYAAATALYDYAMSSKDIDHDKLVATGWSLGAAVAIDLAARKKMAGLITMSAYTSKRDLARIQFPNVPPDKIEHPFLSRDKVRTITCPTLIIHGTLDGLVPFTMSRELRDAAAGKPLTYLPIEGASHNDLFLIGGKTLESAIQTFLEQLSPGPTSRPQ